MCPDSDNPAPRRLRDCKHGTLFYNDLSEWHVPCLRIHEILWGKAGHTA